MGIGTPAFIALWIGSLNPAGLVAFLIAQAWNISRFQDCQSRARASHQECRDKCFLPTEAAPPKCTDEDRKKINSERGHREYDCPKKDCGIWNVGGEKKK